MSQEQIIMAITPFLVFAVTELVKFLAPKLPGWAIVSVIVPLISAVLSWVGTLISPEATWLVNLFVGLLSTFLFELKKQLASIPTS